LLISTVDLCIDETVLVHIYCRLCALMKVVGLYCLHLQLFRYCVMMKDVLLVTSTEDMCIDDIEHSILLTSAVDIVYNESCNIG
jgi:hypothetical protein